MKCICSDTQMCYLHFDLDRWLLMQGLTSASKDQARELWEAQEYIKTEKNDL